MFADCYVNSKGDIPDDPHYLILKFTSVHIPGDERSRTHPGHGYPAHTESVVKAEVFLTEENLKKEILQLEERGQSYRVLYVNPVDIAKEVSIRLKTNL